MDVAEEIVTDFTLKKGNSSSLSIQSRHGEVKIASMERKEQDGVVFLDVYLGNTSGDPHYRIVNPPVLVPDRNGLIMIDESPDQDESQIRTYRRDPLAALAEVIATHRGGR